MCSLTYNDPKCFPKEPEPKEGWEDKIENLRRRYDNAMADGMADIWDGYEKLWFYGEIKELLAQQKKDTIEEVIQKIRNQDFMERLGDVPTQYLSSESLATIKSHDDLIDQLDDVLDQLKK